MVAKRLSQIHQNYVVVPADKASNNIVFICKRYYVDCLLKELSTDDTTKKSTYERSTLSKNEILANHKSVLISHGVSCKEDDVDLPSLYWIPKLHKYPYKQRFIAGSSSCSTKPLSKLLTVILTKVKEGLKKYCDTIYSRSGVNQMWILKNSKQLLEYLHLQSLKKVSTIKTYDFSTLYTTIPHANLKSKLKGLINQAFVCKNGKRRYQYIVVKNNLAYFVKDQSDAKQKYTEIDIVNMLNFLIDNIYVQFGGRIYQQTIGIPMGTNCAPLLADLFLYSYEAEFIQQLCKSGVKKQSMSFNFTFRYIDDVLSLNNPKFHEYLGDIYPEELDIKDTTDSPKFANYLDLRLEIDENHNLREQLFDKRDDFDFPIVNFPYLCSNVPASPAYGVFVSQLIRYTRASSRYQDFRFRGSQLASRLLGQGYSLPRLKATFKKFYGRHHQLLGKYDKSVSSMTKDLFAVSET